VIDKAGWEVEGFIDRLTRRDDSNSERLVLEAISHLRAFSRDCDALRAELAAERRANAANICYAKDLGEGIERLREEIDRLKNSINIRLNDWLCEMKPGYDDSIVGFNEAWDIVRNAFKDFDARAPRSEEKGTSDESRI
jgi:hypothetical protein